MNSFKPDDIDKFNSEFPSEMSEAIDRAKKREVSCVDVEQFKQKVLSRNAASVSGESPVLRVRSHSSYKTITAMMACIAALGMILLIRITWSDLASDPVVTHSARDATRYSAVTTIVLTSSSLGSVDADFERTYSRIDDASEALQLSEIRREIGNILEDEIDWRNKR